MPFTTERNVLDSGIVVLKLAGTMTMGAQLQQLEWDIADLLKNNQKRIAVDMAAITYLDSSAIGAIVGASGSVRNGGGQLRLAAVTDRVKTIFKMTGLERVLGVDATVDEAVAKLAAVHPS